MGLTRIAGVIALALMAIPATAQTSPPAGMAAPVDPARLAMARQIIAVAYPPDAAHTLMRPLMDRMIALSRANMRTPPGFDDPGLKALLDRYLDEAPKRAEPVIEQHIPMLMDAMAQAYARNFSNEDLIALLAFAQTPAGTHYFQRAMALTSDPSVTAELGAMIRDSQAASMASALEFKQQVKAYLAAHPEVEKRMNEAEALGASAAPATQ